MNHLTKNIKTLATAIAMAVGVIVNTSCEHKPLYVLDNTPRAVRLVFDWQNLRPEDTKPEGMHITFAGESNDTTVTYNYDVPTTTGLLTKILPMQYLLTGYSNDIPELDMTPVGDDIKLTALEPGNDIPSIYFVNQKELIENAFSEDDETDVQTITAVPFPVNCIYTVKVINDGIVTDATEWSASLSGLTDAIMLSNGKSAPSANEATRTFTLTPQGENLQAVLSVLGKLEGKDNALRIKVKRQNGISSTFKTDVTSQIDKAPDFRNVLIVVDLNDCEEDTDGTSGSLNPAVDEFPENEEEIKM